MSETARLQRLTVTEESRISLPRGVRLRLDETRNIWVMLVPERVLALDETAVEILQLCDGSRTVGQLIDTLAEKYTAADREAISVDVFAMLQDLADKNYLADLRENG